MVVELFERFVSKRRIAKTEEGFGDLEGDWVVFSEA